QHRAARALPGRGSRLQRERAAGVPAGRSRPHRGPPGMGGRGGQTAMTQVVPADLQDTLARVLGAAFRLDRVAALSAEGALEHAHARGVILRRIVPMSLMLGISGRAVITDLRYANWCLAHVPPDDQGASGPFTAPEVRAGGPGEPASDAYAVAAIVYYALTGHEPDADPAKIVPPRRLRPPVPKAPAR